MANALLTGVSGLIVHQRMLEVVGNNLANLNTTGFKSQRILFSDLFYQTIRPAATDNTGGIGGSNPSQIGSGSKISQIDPSFAQGTLENTGRSLDFGIQGEGFFVINDGTNQYYSRSGAFSIDRSGYLVDPSNGFRVVRSGELGEGDEINPTFQTAGDPGILIPLGSVIAGQQTQSITLGGNLSALLTEAAQEVLTSSSPLETGGAAATLATLLNDLDTSSVPYIAGDEVLIGGTDFDGASVSTSLPVDATSTVGDLIAAISGAYPGSTASLAADGSLLLTADATGPAALSLSLTNDAGNTGSVNFGAHPMRLSIEGKDADTVVHAIEVFDERGIGHTIDLTFTKVGPSTWDMTAAMDEASGTLSDNQVDTIQFNNDGTLQQVLGAGVGDPAITFTIDSIGIPQTVQLSFGDGDPLEGLTHMALGSSVRASQDGFPPGSLNTINVSSDGVIEGEATNGRRFPLAQLAMASFRNTKGLELVGQNYFAETVNSGEAEIGAALTAGRGSINGNQLESSNVDISFEFTRMIVAQRGFSANARTITVTDEVLEELTNLIR